MQQLTIVRTAIWTVLVVFFYDIVTLHNTFKNILIDVDIYITVISVKLYCYVLKHVNNKNKLK